MGTDWFSVLEWSGKDWRTKDVTGTDRSGIGVGVERIGLLDWH